MMIKKWGNFINEDLSDILNKKDKSNDDIKDLLSESEQIFVFLMNYASYKYDKFSLRILSLVDTINDEFLHKEDIKLTSHFDVNLFFDVIYDEFGNNKELIYKYIKEAISIYGIIKHIDYKKKGDILLELDELCNDSLQDGKVYDIYENTKGIHIVVNFKHLDIKVLDSISYDIIPLVKRIEDYFGLKNIDMFIEHQGNIEILLTFNY